MYKRVWASCILLAILAGFLSGCGIFSCENPLLAPFPRCQQAAAPEPEAVIRWSCPGCLPGQPVGFAPLAAAFYAEKPDNADRYLWDFGDGTTSEGRFVQKTFSVPGSYTVRLFAEIGNAKAEGNTHFQVLAPKRKDKDEAVYAEENLFLNVSVLSPQSLHLREVGLVCIVWTAKQALDVLDLQIVASEHFREIGPDHDFEKMHLYVPASASEEHCVEVMGFRSGDGYVQIKLFASDGKRGAKMDFHIPIQVQRND